jgi:hypothetical protein
MYDGDSDGKPRSVAIKMSHDDERKSMFVSHSFARLAHSVLGLSVSLTLRDNTGGHRSVRRMHIDAPAL